MFDQLVSIADALRMQDVAGLPDARIEEEFAALEIDGRGLHQRDGHLSAVSWLANTHAMSRAAAASDVRVARALDHMPEASKALYQQEVSLQAVKVLASAQRFDAEAFATSESLLVDAAKGHPLDDLQRVVGFWRHRVAEQRHDADLRDRRGLHASVTFGGMVRIDGNLDPETGESVLTALGAVIDADSRLDDDDRRTPAHGLGRARRSDRGRLGRAGPDRADRCRGRAPARMRRLGRPRGHGRRIRTVGRGPAHARRVTCHAPRVDPARSRMSFPGL
jgi:hypothetical protein